MTLFYCCEFLHCFIVDQFKLLLVFLVNPPLNVKDVFVNFFIADWRLNSRWGKMLGSLLLLPQSVDVRIGFVSLIVLLELLV